MLPSDSSDVKDIRITEHPNTDEKLDLNEDPKEASTSGKEGGPGLADGGKSAIGVEAGPADEQSDTHARTAELAGPPIPVSVFDEIRELQQRLFDLEEQAIQGVADHGSGNSVDPPELKPGDARQPINDWEFRKRIRRATSGKRWTERVERQAEETNEERKQYGQGPNDWTGTNRDDAYPTIFHVQKDGTMIQGNTRHAIWKHGGWYDEHPDDLGLYDYEDYLRRHHRPHPRRGVRPPTSLRPVYPPFNAVQESRSRGPRFKSSKKLGPPTEWDQSDSEEWSSDTSISSQDFNYFRARLRGDFEWELDRLNAQMGRYQKYKAKKDARARAAKEKDEDEAKEREEQSWREKYRSLANEAGQGVDIEDNGGHRKTRLNLVGWKMFQTTRMAPKELSFVIDVLEEEPKIGADFRVKVRKHKLSTIDNTKRAEPFLPGLKAPITGKIERENDQGKLHSQVEHWNGQGALPERIRINSRSIIESLSSFHGSPICEDPTQSVVILRPFRILSFYEKEIRELSSNNMEDTRMEKSEPTPKATQKAHDVPLATIPVSEETSEDPAPTVENAPSQEVTINEKELEVRRKHLKCLQEFMDEYIGKKIAYLNSVGCTKIVFSDLWYLFQPGTLVISADGKQAYQVVSIRSKQHRGTDRRNMWDALLYPDSASDDSASSNSSDERKEKVGHHDITIQCVYIHFDGHELGPVLKPFGINKWDGEKDISFLEMHPLHLHILKGLQNQPLSSTTEASISRENMEKGVHDLRRRLIERGMLFAKVASVRHMYYSGFAVNTRDEIESQVMIDFEAAFSDDSRKHWVPRIKRLLGTDWDADAHKRDKECSAECCRDEAVHNDSYVETRNRQNFINSMIEKMEDTTHKIPSAIVFPRSLEDTKHDGSNFTEDELVIMSYSVFGFVLRDRTWAELDLAYLSDVAVSVNTPEQADDDLDESDQGAFGQLVLPKGHKKMVLSLISQHFRNKGSLDMNEDQVDIVRGKGKGLIILLHGAPGVGKTTTAEGVAETFGKPLFQITCGDLGSSPKEVEQALQTNFALANRWGCILLLDEADVFLAERRREDFNRNGMVAVFLRVLEYYAGILFLTTNRIGDFDEAFASRIHMSLHYPALDDLSTMKVFRLNLGMIKSRLKEKIKIDDDEIVNAAMKHWREHQDARWNGRQIRNACQTALALAENEAQPKGQKYSIAGKTDTKVHLTLSHLEVVSDAYLDFTRYLKAVHGADAEGRAKESGLRALDTLLEALKSDKVKGSNEDSRHPEKEPRRPAASNSPLHNFTLRPSSSGQHQSTAAPFTPDTRPAQPAPQSGWAPPPWSHDPLAFQAQRMEHNQQRFHAGNQPFNDSQPGTPTAQPGSAGRHPHTPQLYGMAAYGQHYTPPIHERQDSQPYATLHPGVTPSHAGPSGPHSHGTGPGFNPGGDQSGRDQ